MCIFVLFLFLVDARRSKSFIPAELENLIFNYTIGLKTSHHLGLDSFVRSFICSFVRSVVRSFGHSIVRSFIHSFIHLFVRSFIHSSTTLSSNQN